MMFLAFFSPTKFFLAKLPMPYLKQYIRLVTYQKSEKSMAWLPRRARKRIFSHLFRHFRPKKSFSCKTAYAIFKVVYQASHIPKIRKNLWSGCQEMLKNAYFSHLFRHFWQTNFFFKNPASSVFLFHQYTTPCKKSKKSHDQFSVTFIRTDRPTIYPAVAPLCGEQLICPAP